MKRRPGYQLCFLLGPHAVGSRYTRHTACNSGEIGLLTAFSMQTSQQRQRPASPPWKIRSQWFNMSYLRFVNREI
jgi:hypothetical protein